MNILVTGGAGYIGSFMVRRLLDDGHKVTVVDNLERGYRDAIDKRARFIQEDLKNLSFLQEIFSKESFDAVIHFAGYISVEESTKFPQKYSQNNIGGSGNLLRAMTNGKVNKIIFSSTAAVYGNMIRVPISEDHPRIPTNPYGKSKLEIEEMLKLWQKQHGINFVSLRYFNAAGGAIDGSLGENHKPETHIIPNAINSALENREFTLYGNDYATSDGTCIRDYIHVIDLVEAHVAALEKLRKENGGFFYNVGAGKGYSNKEVIDMVKKVSGVDIKLKIADRRNGDAGILVADSTKIKKELGFSPKYSDLEKIVKTAWQWHKRNSELRIHNSE